MTIVLGRNQNRPFDYCTRVQLQQKRCTPQLVAVSSHAHSHPLYPFFLNPPNTLRIRHHGHQIRIVHRHMRDRPRRLPARRHRPGHRAALLQPQRHVAGTLFSYSSPVRSTSCPQQKEKKRYILTPFFWGGRGAATCFVHIVAIIMTARLVFLVHVSWRQFDRPLFECYVHFPLEFGSNEPLSCRSLEGPHHSKRCILYC